MLKSSPNLEKLYCRKKTFDQPLLYLIIIHLHPWLGVTSTSTLMDLTGLCWRVPTGLSRRGRGGALIRGVSHTVVVEADVST